MHGYTRFGFTLLFIACAGPAIAKNWTVSSAADLHQALGGALPGDVIRLEAIEYLGEFKITRSGNRTQPITLRGATGSILSSGSIASGYALHISAAHWNISGIEIRESKKGVVLDSSKNIVLENCTVTQIGEEGLHLRSHSVGNWVKRNTVSYTGLLNPGFGEGVYIGSAKNHWCDFTKCRPDRSDYNTVSENWIHHTAAEAIDVKEGTTRNRIVNNIFDGSLISGANSADSVVDIKGNNTLVEGNQVKLSAPSKLRDAFQVHVRVRGWGIGTRFFNNSVDASIPGYAISVDGKAKSTIVACSNQAAGARLGLSNISCR